MNMEVMTIDLLRAALLLWLDARDELLCALSSESGEWPDDCDVAKFSRRMRRMMARARSFADSIDDEPAKLIWRQLDDLAAIYGYSPTVNWSLHVRAERGVKNGAA